MGGQVETKKTSLAYWRKKKSTTEYGEATSVVVVAHKLHGE
jgi:hypothetical protein